MKPDLRQKLIIQFLPVAVTRMTAHDKTIPASPDAMRTFYHDAMLEANSIATVYESFCKDLDKPEPSE